MGIDATSGLVILRRATMARYNEDVVRQGCSPSGSDAISGAICVYLSGRLAWREREREKRASFYGLSSVADTRLVLAVTSTAAQMLPQ